MSRHRLIGAAALVVTVLCFEVFGAVSPAPALAPEKPSSSRVPVVPSPSSSFYGYAEPLSGFTVRIPKPRIVAPPIDALCPEWWALAQTLGWERETLYDLDVVLHRESRCEPDVWNREDPMGGSRGLMQVNGSWTRWLRERGILVVKEDLFDPVVNLRAAHAIYLYGVDRYGFGWGPWGFRYVSPRGD